MPSSKSVKRAASFTLAVALCGCADFGGPIGSGSGAPLTPEQQRYQDLDSRLAELTRKVDNLRSASPVQAITRIEAEVRTLRGEIETLSYKLETQEKRSRELYQDLDRRMQKLESESRPARLSLDSSISNAPPVPVSQEEEAAYMLAFDQLKNGNYDQAIAGFSNQLQLFPDGRFAVNALYWTGEAHAAKREFEKARDSFQNLLGRFPGADKAPDAQFKLGVAEWELKRPEQAKAAWKKVVADFPGSNAAELARQRLGSAK